MVSIISDKVYKENLNNDLEIDWTAVDSEGISAKSLFNVEIEAKESNEFDNETTLTKYRLKVSVKTQIKEFDRNGYKLIITTDDSEIYVVVNIFVLEQGNN